MPWPEAKELMRGEFVASEGQLGLVSDEVMRISPLLSDSGGIKGAFLLDVDSFHGWGENLLVDGESPALDEADQVAIMRRTEEAVATLEKLSIEARTLFEDALLTYWEGDMGYRVPGAEAAGLPSEFWAAKGGHFRLRTGASDGGWKIHVNFDSAQFPLLDSVFAEALRRVRSPS